MEAALRSRHTMKVVWPTLAEQAENRISRLSSDALASEEEQSADRAGCRGKHTLPTEQQGLAESEVFECYDALANLRRMEAKLEGFTTIRRL